MKSKFISSTIILQFILILSSCGFFLHVSPESDEGKAFDYQELITTKSKWEQQKINDYNFTYNIIIEDSTTLKKEAAIEGSVSVINGKGAATIKALNSFEFSGKTYHKDEIIDTENRFCIKSINEWFDYLLNSYENLDIHNKDKVRTSYDEDYSFPLFLKVEPSSNSKKMFMLLEITSFQVL